MKRSFLPLVFVLLTASCQRGEPVDLKMALQPGSQYAYTSDMKLTMDVSAMGMDMKTEQTRLMESTYEVSAGAGDDRHIKISYDRIAMSLNGPNMHMNYDSQDPAKSNKEMAMMGDMLHKPFMLEVNKEGQIKKILGLSDMLKDSDDTSAEAKSMRQQIANTFDDTTIRNIVQQSLDIFPGHPVRPGDTWHKTYTTAVGPVSMRIDNEFKLKSVSGNIAHLTVAAKITGGGKSPSAEMQNMSMDIKGDQKGTMDVEVATGLVTESQMTQTIKGDMGMSGMKVPISINSEIHLTGKKK